MEVVKRGFGVVDYVVFVLFLSASMGIGLFYAFTGDKQRSVSEVLVGNRRMRIVPVALSLLVSFLSSLTLLGHPAEVYSYGTQYWLYVVAGTVAAVITAVVFVPLLYPLQLTSIFEYLELRFQSRVPRLVGCLINVCMQIFYMGMVIFGPSLALNAVTEIPVWITMVITTAVSTIYTILGGMKAVVWTDVFQSLVILAGLLAIVIQGTLKVGGLSNVWQISWSGGRTEFFDFDVDVKKRSTFWSVVIGQIFQWIGLFTSQTSVQRLSSLPSQRSAQIAVLLNGPGLVLLGSLACFSGVVAYAYYAHSGCDPIKSGLISNPNQIIPYFVLEVLHYPGMSGLFTSCLFGGSLSTMSSLLSSTAANVWEDLLKHRFNHLSDRQMALRVKILVGFGGALALACAFMANTIGGTLTMIIVAFVGAALGPLLGMLILAAFSPYTGWKGISIGAICGLAVTIWISIGAITSNIQQIPLPTNITSCVNELFSVNATTGYATNMGLENVTGSVLIEGDKERSLLVTLYSVSYLWYCAIGMTITVFIGVVSIPCPGFKHTKAVDPALLSAFARFLLKYHCCCGPEESHSNQINSCAAHINKNVRKKDIGASCCEQTAGAVMITSSI